MNRKGFYSDIVVGDWGGAVPSGTNGLLRVVTWNIHFGSGPYEPRIRPPRKAVQTFLDGICEVLGDVHCDIIFIQECDFRSARSRDIDQMRYLARKLGFRYMAPTITWKKPYVPYPLWPPRAHYGRVLSGQVILSRYPLDSESRLLFSKPRGNPWWYNFFYLDRCVTKVRARVGESDLTLFNVHLEAFDRQARMEQARLLVDFFRRERGGANVMAGDFNALPGEAARKQGFPDEPDHDMSGDATIEIMGETGLKEIIGSEEYARNEGKHFTFPSYAPNRRLDYLFVGPVFRVVEARVLTEAAGLSDHLPVMAELQWPGS